MISLKGVSRSWDEFGLRNISLDIAEGEYHVILGPTGAGKTLLLELIAGFYYPESGQIFRKGVDITYLEPQKRSMGFVYQDYALFPTMSVAQNIAYGPILRGTPRDVVDERVHEMAELFGIQHLLERKPGKLSGGEKQRTALARALAVEPDILLLDEPLGALDSNLQVEIRSEIKRLHMERGITTIHVTHNRSEAMILGDGMAVMKAGRIVQSGTPEDVFRRPRSRFVAEFVGVENIFRGVVKKKDGLNVFTCGNTALISSTNISGKVHATIRPEDIILSSSPVSSSARNCIRGTVREILDTGPVMQVNVDADALFAVNITRESCIDMNVTIGQDIYMVFKAQNVNLFI